MILDLLGSNQKELSLGEISKKLGFPKPTTHGLLSTLINLRYIKKSSVTGFYSLGIRLFELGSTVTNNWDFRKIAVPYMENLLEELHETVQLAVLADGEVLYVDKRESRQSLRVVSDIGMRLPAHCTSLGKILLAYKDEKGLQKILGNRELKKFTKNTITDSELLRHELLKIKQLGYAVDNEEFMEGLFCVAAPIIDYKSIVVAALSVSGPVRRIKGEKLAIVIKKICETSREISVNLVC